jgi:hypothetical protein
VRAVGLQRGLRTCRPQHLILIPRKRYNQNIAEQKG